MPMKYQRKAIVNDFLRSGTDILLKNKWMKSAQWSRHIIYALPLAGADNDPPLTSTTLPLSGGIWINFRNQHRVIHLDPTRHIKNALSLAGAVDDIHLTDAALPLTGGIRINGNDLHFDIRYDPVIKLHDLDGKHNVGGIYHNKIMPPVGSSIHFYEVRKKGDQGTMPFWIRDTLVRSVCLIPWRKGMG